MKLKDFFTLEFDPKSIDRLGMENLEKLQKDSEEILVINPNFTKSVWKKKVIGKKFDQESEEAITDDVERYKNIYIKCN